MSNYNQSRCRHLHDNCPYCDTPHTLSEQSSGKELPFIYMPPSVAWNSAPLPADEEGWKHFSTCGMVEFKSNYYLTYKRVINWCPLFNQLYPVLTSGDGNCLMNAVSLYLCTTQDISVQLRHAVYRNLAHSTLRDMLRLRWRSEREWQNANIPDGGLHYTAEEWRREWDKVVTAADDQLQPHPYADILSYEYLEEIHVFTLANVLRRPIIVLGEPFTCGRDGESLEQNNFVGIYLPLLWSPRSCYPVPIVIGFIVDHFVPLLARDRASLTDDEVSRIIDAVPLVTADLEPLRIHFLLSEEQGYYAHNLLQMYLITQEVEFTGQDGSSQMVLCAKLYNRDSAAVYDLLRNFSTAQSSNMSGAYGDSVPLRHGGARPMIAAVPEAEQCAYFGCSKKAVMKPPAAVIYLPLDNENKKIVYCRHPSLKLSRFLLKQRSATSVLFCLEHAPNGSTEATVSHHEDRGKEIAPFSQPVGDEAAGDGDETNYMAYYKAMRRKKMQKTALYLLLLSAPGSSCMTDGCDNSALDDGYCVDCGSTHAAAPSALTTGGITGDELSDWMASTKQASGQRSQQDATGKSGARRDESGLCRGPCCRNAGLQKLRGLCTACYRTLLVHNYSLLYGPSLDDMNADID